MPGKRFSALFARFEVDEEHLEGGDVLSGQSLAAVDRQLACESFELSQPRKCLVMLDWGIGWFGGLLRGFCGSHNLFFNYFHLFSRFYQKIEIGDFCLWEQIRSEIGYKLSLVVFLALS